MKDKRLRGTDGEDLDAQREEDEERKASCCFINQTEMFWSAGAKRPSIRSAVVPAVAHILYFCSHFFLNKEPWLTRSLFPSSDSFLLPKLHFILTSQPLHPALYLFRFHWRRIWPISDELMLLLGLNQRILANSLCLLITDDPLRPQSDQHQVLIMVSIVDMMNLVGIRELFPCFRACVDV